MINMNQIIAINQAVEEYFSKNKSVDKVPAKDLMPWFIKKGIFTKDSKNGLPIRKILRELDKKDQLSKIPSAYPERKIKNTYWYFIRLDESISNTKEKSSIVSKKVKPNKPSQTSIQSISDEAYVIDLCDEILNLQASRQHKFSFLLGDPDKRNRRRKLPVDAYYEQLNLVIEYREKQHTEEVKHFDKPDVMTVSGVSRGVQRKIYDQRRREILPKHRIKLVEISYSDFDYNSKKKIIRNKSNDLLTIKQILIKEGVKLK